MNNYKFSDQVYISTNEPDDENGDISSSIACLESKYSTQNNLKDFFYIKIYLCYTGNSSSVLCLVQTTSLLILLFIQLLL